MRIYLICVNVVLVQELINRTKSADRLHDRIDAVKQLGVLNCSDSQIIAVLRQVLAKDTDERVIYESTKSLITFGTEN